MDSDSWLQILLFSVLLLTGSYFAAAESAFSAMNRIRIKNYADDGNKRAKNALYIYNNFDDALTAILVGTNISHIACAALSAAFVIDNFKSAAAITYSTVITTVLVFLISEMIPKSYANAKSDDIAMACAGSLRVIIKLFIPLVLFFRGITSLVKKIFTSPATPTVTEDELYDIIETIEEEGVLGEEQSSLFKSALSFSDKTAGDVMTMRDDITAVDVSLPADKIVEIIKDSHHSRIPVYEGDLDNIIGILHARKFFKGYINSKDIKIRGLLDEAYFIEKNSNINDLLDDMSRRRVYLAIVRGETDGGARTVGLVTIEDFLEELVGEIWDEEDVVDDNFIKLGGNRFMVNGAMPAAEAFRRMKYTGGQTYPGGYAYPQGKSVHTWVLESLGHTPEADECFVSGELEVIVEEIEDNRVMKVIIKLDAE